MIQEVLLVYALMLRFFSFRARDKNKDRDMSEISLLEKGACMVLDATVLW